MALPTVGGPLVDAPAQAGFEHDVAARSPDTVWSEGHQVEMRVVQVSKA